MKLCPICKKNPWVKCWRFCVGRVLVAILIAFLCSTATAGKPSLLFFTDPGRCAPCRQFDADWRRDKMFRQAVETAFAIVPSYQPGTHPEKFRQYAIASVPTWVIVEPEGRERGRVAGYTTPQDLWARLQNATKNTPPTAPTAGSVPEPDAGVLQRLQDANRALENERDALRAEIRQLERRIAQTPQTGDQTSLIASLKAEIKRFEVQIQRLNAEASKRITAAEKVAQNATAEAERLRKQCELPLAPEYHDEPIVETPTKPETSKRGFLGSILFHGSRFARDLGLSQVQAEIFTPIAIAAGPIGIAAAAGFAFLRLRQRRARGDPPPRQQPQQATPVGGVTVERTFVVDSPPLPQRERIDTQFVNVESDKYRKAHEQARQQIARKYPGSQEILEAELSLTRQFYAGQA